MKPSKKKAAKRPSSLSVRKLLDLKYRINDAYKRTTLPTDDPNRLSLEILGDTRVDKNWVMGEIHNIRTGGWLSATKMKVANEMWRNYAG